MFKRNIKGMSMKAIKNRAVLANIVAQSDTEKMFRAWAKSKRFKRTDIDYYARMTYGEV